MMEVKPKTPWKKLLLLCGLFVLLYWAVSASSTLWDRDEPRFSRATVEMLESGHWLVPTFNGEERLHKPILVYWLMMGPIKLFGANAFAARFMSGVGTGITLLFTFLIARRLFNTLAAFWSVVILGTSLMVMAMSSFATADGVLLPGMTAAMAFFIFACTEGKMKIRYVAGMSISLGLALLAKGPVALLPVLGMVTILVLARKEASVHPWPYLGAIMIAIVIGAAMFIAWGIPANIATEGRFLQEGLGKHVVGRSAESFEGHGGNFFLYLFFYPVIIIAGFFPWSMHLPGALSAAFGKRLAGSLGRSILLGWILPPVIVMTFVATKLPHYVISIWPALAIAVAATIFHNTAQDYTDRDRKWLKAGPWFFGPVSGGITLALLIAPWFLPGILIKVAGILGATIFIAMGTLADRSQKKLDPATASITLVLGILCFQIILIGGLLPGLENIKMPPKIAAAIKQNTAPDTPVAAVEFKEPTLMFYTGRPVETFGEVKDVIPWIKQNTPCAVILPFDDVETLKQLDRSITWSTSTTIKGINYSKSIDEQLITIIYCQ